MTDVNIAMELLVDAQQDMFETALLVSADTGGHGRTWTGMDGHETFDPGVLIL